MPEFNPSAHHSAKLAGRFQAEIDAIDLDLALSDVDLSAKYVGGATDVASVAIQRQRLTDQRGQCVSRLSALYVVPQTIIVDTID